MFIGKYELEGKIYHNIYNNTMEGWKEWHKDTFSPNCKNIELLSLMNRGKTYEERKYNLEEIAKEWQLYFSHYDWSYYELMLIQDWFYTNARRYGLVRVFKENAIC